MALPVCSTVRNAVFRRCIDFPRMLATGRAPPCARNRLGTSFVYPKLRGTPDIFSSGVPRAVLLARGRHCFAKKGCAAGAGGTLQSQFSGGKQRCVCGTGLQIELALPQKPLCFLWKCETVSFLSKGKERNGVTLRSFTAFSRSRPRR